jgi:hypothetical protein
MDEVENLFFDFQILGPLGCQGWVVMTKNMKKPKSLHPTPHSPSPIAFYLFVSKHNVFYSDTLSTDPPLFESDSIR